MTSFDPKTTKFPYPKDTAGHYIRTKKKRSVFDEHYQYIDKRKVFTQTVIVETCFVHSCFPNC